MSAQTGHPFAAETMPPTEIQARLDCAYSGATANWTCGYTFHASGALRAAVADMADMYGQYAPDPQPTTRFTGEVLGTMSALTLATVAPNAYPDLEPGRAQYLARIGVLAAGGASTRVYFKGSPYRPHHSMGEGSYSVLKVVSLPAIPEASELGTFVAAERHTGRTPERLRALGEELLEQVQDPEGLYAIARFFYAPRRGIDPDAPLHFSRAQGWDAIIATPGRQPAYRFYPGEFSQ